MDIADVYGPPPIEEEKIQKKQANTYGPPPVLRKKKSLWGVIIFAISVILGGLIFYAYRMISTVYGPPPVDIQHDVEPDVYGPPPVSKIEEIPEEVTIDSAQNDSRE